MKTLLSIFLLFSAADLLSQYDLKVGGSIHGSTVMLGNNNTVVNNIFGKSPEYAELKKHLDGLQAAIAKKADECEQMAKDGLPQKYRDNCRADLIAMNLERDSVQKIEIRFREDVIRLAESFSKIELNSERLRLAKKFFDEGKIREADNVLKEKDMAATGDAALAAKARNDSILLQTANEFALKAQLKALKMDYDSAQTLFAQSRKYFETVDNLWDFAYLLGEQNQSHRAIEYYEKALKLARFESEEARLTMNLGQLLADVQKMAESEKMYLRSLGIFERLIKVNPIQYEPDLAMVYMNMGNFYDKAEKIAESEKMYLRSIEIKERLVKANPRLFEPDLAKVYMNMGNFYCKVQRMAESEKMYLRSLDIFERLIKVNPILYEPNLAVICMNLGTFYLRVEKIAESEKMYLRSLEIKERLAKTNPAKFEHDLAIIYTNMGNFYRNRNVQRMAESEKMYLRSIDIFERLIKANLILDEPALATTYASAGAYYFFSKQKEQAEINFLKANQIYRRLSALNPLSFDLDIAEINVYLYILKRQKGEKAEAMALLKECFFILKKYPNHPRVKEISDIVKNSF